MRRFVCLAVLLVESGFATAADVAVDKDKKTVTVAAKIAPRKIDDPKFKGVVYPIEVIACWGYPKGEKAHETVLTITAKPSEVHKALESLGLKAGKPVKGEKGPGTGPEVNVYLEVPGDGGGTRKIAIDRLLLDPKTNKPMPKVKWRFTGSAMVKPNPDKDEMAYGADLSGTLIAIFPVTDQTVLQTNLSMKEESVLKLETNKKLLPAEGKDVKLIIEVPSK